MFSKQVFNVFYLHSTQRTGFSLGQCFWHKGGIFRQCQDFSLWVQSLTTKIAILLLLLTFLTLISIFMKDGKVQEKLISQTLNTRWKRGPDTWGVVALTFHKHFDRQIKFLPCITTSCISVLFVSGVYFLIFFFSFI